MCKFFMRLLGALNLVFVAFGVWYSIGMHSIRMKAGKWPPYPAVWADWVLHLAFLAFNVALVAWLTFLSIWLICANRKALLPTCIVFGIEISYFWADVAYFWGIAPRWVTDRSWFWKEGIDLIVPQLVFGYAIVGLIASLVLLLITRPRTRTW